jgi:hypothetical protein
VKGKRESDYTEMPENSFTNFAFLFPASASKDPKDFRTSKTSCPGTERGISFIHIEILAGSRHKSLEVGRSRKMEILNQILNVIPFWIYTILGIVMVFWMILGFLVPLMIYSMCRRIKTIEWNMNYILFGDRKTNTRNIKGNWRESAVEWVVAVVERRRKELRRREGTGYPVQELEISEDE